MDANDLATLWIVLKVVGTIAGIVILWALVGYPKWRVWAANQEGLADLQRAKNKQQIQIAQAQSRFDAAGLNQKAAVIEAQAVAQQIEAIGKQLTAHDLYLKWQWIKMMEDTSGDGDRTTVYVPTEANVPILEAIRLQK